MTLELSPTALLKKIHEQASAYKNHSANKFLIAFSGGLDSHALLHLLALLDRSQVSLRAIYINHGLQAEANAWSDHCKHICAEYDVPYSSIDLNLQIPKGDSIEEAARNARYAALKSSLQSDEILLTAHHQSDQAETLLLQLFRGAGVQGLAAMPAATEIKHKEQTNLHLRPLLDYARTDLESYAQQYGLEFIEDPSNTDTVFDRNYIRLKLMPELKKHWPSVDKTITRAANIQAETKALLEAFAQENIPSVLVSDSAVESARCESSSITHELPPICIFQLQSHSEVKQRLLLRYWISQQGFDNPSEKKLRHIFSDLINAGDDKQPLIKWRGAELRRYQQKLYIMAPLSEHDESQIIVWDKNEALEIPSLNITLAPTLLEFHDKNTSVRFRRGGEQITIPKRGNLSLKNWFQEQQIPPWLRSRMPLIYQAEKLIKVVVFDSQKKHPPLFE